MRASTWDFKRSALNDVKGSRHVQNVLSLQVDYCDYEQPHQGFAGSVYAGALQRRWLLTRLRNDRLDSAARPNPSHIDQEAHESIVADITDHDAARRPISSPAHN